MQVTLLQWNIWYKEKIENIVKTIKQLNPDIVCLQELSINCRYNPSIPNTAEYIKEQLGYNAFFQEAQRWIGDKDMEAISNGIFTRFSIIKTFSKPVQKQTKDFTDYAHEGRVYVEADIEIDNNIISVGTTHLSCTHMFELTEEKRKEVDNLLDTIKEKKNKYIFTGDLNATPESYTIKEINKYLVHTEPTYEKNTWTTKPFEYQGFKEDKLRWRLDYVFATKDMKVASAEIIQTPYSDHLPVLINFLL